MANAVGPEEDLLPSIRQLITSVAPSLQAAGSLAAAEECLFHLEETDENFHRSAVFSSLCTVEGYK